MATRMLLDRYEVGPTLGSGLSGKVKLATDTTTGQKVALKLIDAKRLESKPKERANLEREIAIMKRLSHSNIVNLRDVEFGVTWPKRDGTPKREVVAIVIDLAEGGELFDFMMYTGCFPEGIARAYFKQLINGLEHCHKEGVSHRDLKPENLLLSKDFQLQIADFGLSALTENEDGTPSLLRTECGTRGYMAPEVLAGTPYRGEAADIWSAGCVLFIMLAGFPPFQIASNTDWWFQRIRNRQYPLFWEAHLRSAMFSPGAMALIQKIFVADPGERATIEMIKADEWFRADDVPADTLAAELTRRKEQVQREKRREREAEERKKAEAKRARAAARGDETFDAFAEPVYRSVGGAGDGEGKGEEEADATPAPALPDDSVARFTYFYTNSTATAVTSRLSQAFSGLSADYDVTADTYKIKAKVSTPGGAVELRTRVYKAADGLHMVDFTRRQGDMLKFQDVFKTITEKLSDVIVAGPDELDAAAGEGGGAGGAAE
uniref:non-specific serine/threonine protein kinase n=1 Tax=Bicosoecida sp. CB-2014 TaxID=1486930 RepID=A0A7S1CPA7_9STRA|mmetsp:Transcript_6417/g.22886  ORF Transcript_6417/g.22886 Transcript_6417/m.22886 type:complete len:492 (+) Transcript_6417:55-1530(+)|eukprot:CAMPEP_0203815164 /NCGR_PEP_ID=MMETSP0115-20131106/8070_1 /ASSEMBLY_ACC=CAM_ASM_000227 /TAXON_ID=33651 /ORGANISM="Bicosoecid sp, Strain ms1" /LENGTH=491 /DNA_ID=CAMNT_0050724057 /DNA_START=39 /DNA_END=1514 /DNA_ORIENTATION=+